MLVALTVTPALSLILLSKTRERGDAPLVRWMKRGYGALLLGMIRRPWPAYAAAITERDGGTTSGSGAAISAGATNSS